jgi:hemerythrin
MTQSALLEWSDEFSVGNDEIDNQHKMLFELVNRLLLAAVKREGPATVAQILDALVDYTRTHFVLEEDLLGAVGYAGLDTHRQEHRQFVEKMESVTRKFREEERTVTVELISFLRRWLREHILKTDKAYAKALTLSGHATAQWAARARTATEQQERQAASRPWWKFWAGSSDSASAETNGTKADPALADK